MSHPATTNNIVSVSWSDHLAFGEGDGRLNSIDALQRRVQHWREELGAGIIHWRCTRDRIRGKCYLTVLFKSERLESNIVLVQERWRKYIDP